MSPGPVRISPWKSCSPLESLIATLWGTPPSRLWNRRASGPAGATRVIGSKAMLTAVTSTGPLPAGGSVTAPGTSVGPPAADGSTVGGSVVGEAAEAGGPADAQPVTSSAAISAHTSARRSMSPLPSTRHPGGRRPGSSHAARQRTATRTHGTRTAGALHVIGGRISNGRGSTEPSQDDLDRSLERRHVGVDEAIPG